MLTEKATAGYLAAILQEKNVSEKFVPVLSGILSRSFYNQDAGCMEIVVNTYVKKEIAKKAGLRSPGPVGSGLNKFVEYDLLTCVENGVYRFHPAYFGSRPWAEVQEMRIQKCFGIKETIQILAVYADQTETLDCPAEPTEGTEEGSTEAQNISEEEISE